MGVGLQVPTSGSRKLKFNAQRLTPGSWEVGLCTAVRTLARGAGGLLRPRSEAHSPVAIAPNVSVYLLSSSLPLFRSGVLPSPHLRNQYGRRGGGRNSPVAQRRKSTKRYGKPRARYDPRLPTRCRGFSNLWPAPGANHPRKRKGTSNPSSVNIGKTYHLNIGKRKEEVRERERQQVRRRGRLGER